MIEQIINWDKALLLYLNSLNTPFCDFVMYWISDKFIWIPLYLFLLWLVIRNYKIRTIDVVITAAICVAMTDLISVYCFKEVFQRLRPCQDPGMKSLVHLVNGECGGIYSFVSSHAANTFGVCFLIVNILGRKVKYLSVGMIIWASVVSYSRIYLGVHYPVDVFCGAIIGILIGSGVGRSFTWYYEKFRVKKNL